MIRSWLARVPRNDGCSACSDARDKIADDRQEGYQRTRREGKVAAWPVNTFHIEVCTIERLPRDGNPRLLVALIHDGIEGTLLVVSECNKQLCF